MVRRSPSPILLALAVLPAVPAAVAAAQPKPASPARSAKPGGQMYKWVDENGVTHYGQTIPPEYRDQAAAGDEPARA